MIEAVGSALLIVMLAARVRPRAPLRRPGADASPALRWRARLPHRRTRRATITPSDVAAWCDHLAAEVRSGATLTQAVRHAPVPPSLHDAVSGITFRLDRGQPLEHALTAARAAHLDVAIVVLATCARFGGPSAEPLDRAAATLRARAADLGERHAHSAQARLSAVVMTVLPIAMLVLIVTTSAPTREVIFGPTGLAIITLGGLLNVAGWRWMKRIIGANA